MKGPFTGVKGIMPRDVFNWTTTRTELSSCVWRIDETSWHFGLFYFIICKSNLERNKKKEKVLSFNNLTAFNVAIASGGSRISRGRQFLDQVFTENCIRMKMD